MKPNIVFFGEMLPHRFYELYPSDLSTCDLLVVMGTSLEVCVVCISIVQNLKPFPLPYLVHSMLLLCVYTPCNHGNAVVSLMWYTQVHPFAGLVDVPRLWVPRLLINNQSVGPFSGEKQRPNDVVLIGDIVQSVQQIADLCAWTEDLSAFH